VRKAHFIQADVFSDSPFGGNPVIVVPDAHDIPEDQRQLIARGMIVGETAFVLPTDNPSAHFRLQCYTPATKVTFSGHTALGAAYVLGKLGRLNLVEPVTLICEEFEIGCLPVELHVAESHISRVAITENPPVLGDILDDLWDLASALSLSTQAISSDLPCQVMSTGLPTLIVPIRSLESLRDIIPQVPGLNAVCHALGAQCVLAFTFETLNKTSTVHVRLFAPLLGVNEDPATGSGNGGLGAYLVHYGAAGEGPVHHIVSEQGYEVGRPSAIYVDVDSSMSPKKVQVGGRVRKSVEGSIYY
jgi:trans-2,3-dihydro-3-hydroxyanthranilate isomerase